MPNRHPSTERTLITRGEAMRLQARRLRIMAEDLERMAAAAEQGDQDFGYEMIAQYPRI